MEAANASEGKWFTVWSQFVVALWKNLTLSVCKFLTSELWVITPLVFVISG